MGFNPKDKPSRTQVSLNSFSNAAKTVRDEVRDGASALGHHAKSAASNVLHHAKGATSFANKDLKRKMTHRTGRAIDD